MRVKNIYGFLHSLKQSTLTSLSNASLKGGKKYFQGAFESFQTEGKVLELRLSRPTYGAEVNWATQGNRKGERTSKEALS